jgi:hypothetical protein
VVVADHDGHVRLGLVQVLTKQAHRRDVCVELSEVFTRGPDKELRCVYRSECRYDFPHVRYLVFIRPRVRDLRTPLQSCALRDSLPISADSLIVRKVPQFVKKNRLPSEEFQRSVKFLTESAVHYA